MPRRHLACFLLTALAACLSNQSIAETIVDFEGVDLGNEGVFNGPTANAVDVTRETAFGTADLKVGTFGADGVEFSNSYNTAFGSWSGFAVSNQTDTTTPGFGNQYSAFAGAGAGGSSQYAVAFGNQVLEPTSLIGEEFVFDPTDVQRLAELPSIYLPERTSAIKAQVTTPRIPH